MPTPREILDAEKPFFEFVGYVMQAAAVGGACLLAARFKTAQDISTYIQEFLKWSAIVAASAIFFIMVIRIHLMTIKLIEYFDPRRSGVLQSVFWTLAYGIAPMLAITFAMLAMRVIAP